MQKIKWNVLVFPGGTENGLEVKKSLEMVKEVRLISASSPVINHAPFIYEKHYNISDINNAEKCLSDLNALIRKEKIDIIFPCNSLIIDFLDKNRAKIKSELLIPNSKIISIVRSKKKTYNVFRNELPCPHVFSKKETLKYPVFIKPDRLYGSQGVCKIQNEKEFEAYKLKKDDIISEYLPGEEFTIECFTIQDKILFCSGRSRQRIRMGTSMHSEICDHALQVIFLKYCEIIFKKLHIIGLWFFQMKYDINGQLKLLEIEPRVAGTMALNRVRGINFPLLAIYNHFGHNVNILLNNYTVIIDRALINRFKHNFDYSFVYVDLDDTLIVHKKINTVLIKFLYQCINKNKKLFLITKSLSKNLTKTLQKYRISNLFDEIIWLDENQSKADFIKHKDSIFIDDSFSERLNVSNVLGLYTFDNSMIEILMDGDQ